MLNYKHKNRKSLNKHIMKNSVSINHINIARHLRALIERDD